MHHQMVSGLSDAHAMEVQALGGVHARRETAEICPETLREEAAMAGRLEQQLPEVTREFLRPQRAGQHAKR